MLFPAILAPKMRKITDPGNRRYDLGAIVVMRDDDGNPSATATDGRRACIVTWVEPELECDSYHRPAAKDAVKRMRCNATTKGFSRRIPAEALACIARSASTAKGRNTPEFMRHVLIREDAAPKDIRMAATNGMGIARVEVEERGDRYPDVGSIIPQYELISGEQGQAIRVRLNASFLIDALDLIRSVSSCKDQNPVDLIVPMTDSQAVVLKSAPDSFNRKGDVEVTAVVMPLAISEG